MLMNFETVSKLITDGKLLHISGTEALLRKLPKGKWIGGSTEYFMDENGGKVSGDFFHVIEFNYDFAIKSYDTSNIKNIAIDGYDNGFSIVIIPFDSNVHKEYAQKAPTYQDIFMKNIAGWISGLNLGKEGQTPVAVDGMTGEVFADKAVALHLGVGDGKMCSMNIINIFSQDASSPVIEFTEEGFKAEKCLVDGKETKLADYIAQNNIDTKMPLVGEYSGVGVNISFKQIDGGVVHFYAPVFKGIKYRMAKNISDYAKAFNERLAEIKDANIAFSCNCILNFLYGELEGKVIGAFTGPVTFGEIAYQLVNQTLVYVSVK
ncbi:MAG: hypothetical protein LBU88_06470 [Treponema sp.]|jgi:hypothetical protein|nr:hypothetical protein [Treponema sp.]